MTMKLGLVRSISAILIVCVLSVCVLAGCGPTDVDPQNTTTDPNATTTTLSDTVTSDSDATTTATGSQTAKPSSSASVSKSTASTASTAAPTQGAAAITGIAVNGVEFEDFEYSTRSYTYFLPAGTTAVPKVTATKSYGTGDIQLTQPTSVNGTAKVSLNGDTFTIQFVVARSEADMLNNTYYKLKTAKKLNVAYFGGSVTDGHGSTNRSKSWRSLTTAWLKSQYPSASITETSAAIGGTGTIYGAYRAIQDLKLTSASEKPDLVFVEFSANDKYDTSYNTTPDVYMESIIQTIYQYAPQADIVMVFITDFTSKDTDFTQKVAHQKIAEAYQIPCIDVGATLWKEIVQENGGSAPASVNDAAWAKYFTDSVHPTDAGYAKYAAYVQEFLKNIFSKKTAVPSSLTKSYVPIKTITTLPTAPYVANLKGLTPSDTNIKVNSSTGYATASTTGTVKLSFKFTGTDLKLWIYGSSDTPSTGKFQVVIDGTRYDSVTFSAKNHKVVPIVSGLSNGEHTVTLTLGPETKGGSAYLDLRYFLISGDTQMRGITLVS